MQATLAILVWMASSVSSSSYTASTLPDITNEDFIQQCVQIHNQHRAQVNPTARNMMYMSWDSELARIAKSWAKVCQFEHNPRLKSRLHPNFTAVGENIWTGSLSLFSVSSAISSWYNEVKGYDFRTRRCTGVCGHYTQTLSCTFRLFGQIVTRLAVRCNFALELVTLKVFPMEHILYATMDQQEITQRGHTSKEPLAVIAQKMTGVSTISAVSKITTKSHHRIKLTREETVSHVRMQILNCLTGHCGLGQHMRNSKAHSVCFTGYYAGDYSGRPIYLRNRYTSLFLIVKAVLLILSVIITILVKHKYPNLVLLDY
ncbi:hypothetical protein U0070_019233 [Myodes glareolus]|uniref:SCP domain-containing protein n=1 Tax=Myodes glareolus TaxID=447135 RepID=A0AAW0I9Y9_MYOGA